MKERGKKRADETTRRTASAPASINLTEGKKGSSLSLWLGRALLKERGHELPGEKLPSTRKHEWRNGRAVSGEFRWRARGRERSPVQRVGAGNH